MIMDAEGPGGTLHLLQYGKTEHGTETTEELVKRAFDTYADAAREAGGAVGESAAEA